LVLRRLRFSQERRWITLSGGSHIATGENPRTSKQFLAVAVGCPFCLTMMNDASKEDGGNILVKDVAEIVAERMK